SAISQASRAAFGASVAGWADSPNNAGSTSSPPVSTKPATSRSDAVANAASSGGSTMGTKPAAARALVYASVTLTRGVPRIVSVVAVTITNGAKVMNS